MRNVWQMRGQVSFVQTGESKGTPVTRVGLVIKNQRGPVHASFVVFGGYAALVAENIQKGQTVSAEGHINSVVRTDESGAERHTLDLVATAVDWS